jgi:hypothetical protein
MADKQRFELFAQFLVDTFPNATRVFDVAGGMGKLNETLTAKGKTVTTFDLRVKRLNVTYAMREFSLEEPKACDLVVGLHADGATRVIIEYAALHRLPFAVIPCCSDNSMPYNTWMKHLAALATARGLVPRDHTLPMVGRARVLYSNI